MLELEVFALVIELSLEMHSYSHLPLNLVNYINLPLNLIIALFSNYFIASTLISCISL